MRKIFFQIIVLLILLSPSQYLMIKGYKSLDGLIHTERISQFDKALKEQQLPIRLAPNLFDGIGYPLFVVNYQLPYYLAETVMIPFNNPSLAYKLTMSVTFILSAIFIFLLFREITSLQSAFAGAILYAYLPYRFANLYQRGAFGESISLMFIPLIILAYHQIIKNKKYAVILLAFSIFGLITSHTITFIIFAPLLITYIPFVLKPNLEKLKKIALGIILGLLLSSFQLLPSLFEKKYLKFDENLLNIYNNFYLNIYQLLRIPHEGINIGTYYQIGIAASIVLIITSIVLIKKFDIKLAFFLAFAILSIFFTTEKSDFLWRHLPIIKYILYPYRFLNLTIFATAFLATLLVNKAKAKTLASIFLITLTIYTNRHFIYIVPWFEIQPTPNLTTQNENDTIWSNEKTFEKRPIISTNPSSNISIAETKPFETEANVKNQEETRVIVRKMYFPGWQLKVNGQKQNIQIEDGLISTTLKPGTWHLETSFGESQLRKFADALTLFSLLTLIYLTFKPLIINKKT